MFSVAQKMRNLKNKVKLFFYSIKDINNNIKEINNNIKVLNQNINDIKFIISSGTSESDSFIFDSIYINNKWGKGSGGGSDTNYTSKYRDYIASFISEHNDIHSILDIGCGDWQFSKYIDFNNLQYIGYDVSKVVIENNNKLYKKNNINFKFYDGNFEELPQADLCLCKDCLQHLSNSKILSFKKIINRYKYLLLTNDIVNKEQHTNMINNIDIKNGEWRPIDLKDSPFNIICEKVFTFDDVRYGIEKITVLIKN